MMTRPRIKNKRILRERIEKFISPIYFNDVNLFSKLYKDTVKLDKILHYPAPDRISFDEASKNEYKETQIGSSFGPAWSTHWFKLDIDLSRNRNWIGQEVRFRWNSNSEAMVWQDGVPKQGLTGGDNSERWDYILTNNCNGNERITIYIEMAANGLFGAGGNSMIGPPDEKKSFVLSKVEIAILDKDIYKVVNDLKILIDMAQTLPEENGISEKALQVGCDAVNCFQPETECSKQKALSILDQFFKGDSSQNESEDRHQYKIHAMGHCHIDTAWLWPYAETKRKCARSWSSVIGLMKRYPDFTFTCSQAVQLCWVKENYPTLYKDIQEYTTKGQFLPTGGTWVEMDGNIPSGESFIRQFYYGQQFFKKEFGNCCDVFWLPDTFGYSAQLPQIAKQCGIKYFLTQKISWSLVNTFPHNSFVWEGIDGTKILTHFPPADTYESSVSFKDVYRTAKQNKDKGVVSEGVLLYGFGDGGGGPSEDMLENLERMGSISGLPRIEHSTPTKFFESLETIEDKLHKWVGELYLELHQGTFTSLASIKRNNRKLEFLLYNLEFLHVLWVLNSHFVSNHSLWSILFYSTLMVKQEQVFTSLDDSGDGAQAPLQLNTATKEIEEMWKMLLLNQFHDVLPGSSIKLAMQISHIINLVQSNFQPYFLEVNDDAAKIYEDLWTDGNKLIKKHEEVLFNQSKTDQQAEVVVNTLPFPRSEVIQTGNDTYSLVEVPALGYSQLSACSKTGFPPVQVKKTTDNYYILQNKNLTAKFNSCGQLVSCVLLENLREMVLPSSIGNQFLLFTDIPLYWDAWDIMPYTNETGEILNQCSNVEMFDFGIIRAGIKFTIRISEKSAIHQTVTLDANSSFVRFDTEVEWHENRKLLRVAFPMNVHTSQATYGIQNGFVERPTHVNTSWDWAKHEVCGHRWVSLSEYGHGAALLNDCKYGFTAYGSTLQISLLRAPKSPDDHADMGNHQFSYAFMPYSGCFQSANVEQVSLCFNNPLTVVSADQNKTPSKFSMFTINNPAIIVQAIKMHHSTSNNVILRLYESFGGSHPEVTMTSHYPFKSIKRVNALEESYDTLHNGLDSTVLQNDKDIATFKIKPFEIMTVSIQF